MEEGGLNHVQKIKNWWAAVK